jgi:hypothetical protein
MAVGISRGLGEVTTGKGIERSRLAMEFGEVWFQLLECIPFFVDEHCRAVYSSSYRRGLPDRCSESL